MNASTFSLTAVALLTLAACGAEDEGQVGGAGSELVGKPVDPSCVRTGCSGQVCADDHVGTTCEWRPEYACYNDAVCERQADGACGWTDTEELTACLGDDAGTPEPEPIDDCFRTGCSGQVCSDQDVITDCMYRPEYACYEAASCERQSNGACGWTPTPELETCLSAGEEPPVAPLDPCVRTGCSGQICADSERITTCEYRPEYACYADAECARQGDGTCGWTPTDTLRTCLDDNAGGDPTTLQ